MCKFRGLLNALLGWVVHVYLQILLKQETWVYCFIFLLFWLTLILEIILCLCQDWGAREKHAVGSRRTYILVFQLSLVFDIFWDLVWATKREFHYTESSQLLRQIWI